MRKVLIQAVITVGLFFGTWYVLAQVDWVKLFKIDRITNKTEKKLGELYWDVFKNTEREIINPKITKTVDSIVSRICNKNNIDRKNIKVHILEKDNVNAFALPNGYLILYSGLIESTDNPEELAGVISHEIAHIELNHVMKKLVREFGLSVLVSMSGGKGGGEGIKEAAKMLSSTAFDRDQEKEADIRAVDYMIKAQIDPEPYAEFLYRLSNEENQSMQYLNWISTHPETKERAEYIIEHSKNKSVSYQKIISASSWEKMKAEVKEESTN